MINKYVKNAQLGDLTACVGVTAVLQKEDQRIVADIVFDNQVIRFVKTKNIRESRTFKSIKHATNVFQNAGLAVFVPEAFKEGLKA
jgi:hypothetical protein